jgi:hypothetical protein
MKNSTDQFLKTKSSQLTDIRPRDDVYSKTIQPTDFIIHDYHNLYRTSYNDMSTKVLIITDRILNLLLIIIYLDIKDL